MSENAYNLEERLLEYAAMVLRVAESLTKTHTGTHVAKQLLRAATPPFSNHGEAQAAESRNDFIHKMRICHKELRESSRRLKLCMRVPLVKEAVVLDPLLKETDELIAIFFSSIRTARKGGRS